MIPTSNLFRLFISHPSLFTVLSVFLFFVFTFSPQLVLLPLPVLFTISFYVFISFGVIHFCFFFFGFLKHQGGFNIAIDHWDVELSAFYFHLGVKSLLYHFKLGFKISNKLWFQEWTKQLEGSRHTWNEVHWSCLMGDSYWEVSHENLENFFTSIYVMNLCFLLWFPRMIFWVWKNRSFRVKLMFINQIVQYISQK